MSVHAHPARPRENAHKHFLCGGLAYCVFPCTLIRLKQCLCVPGLLGNEYILNFTECFFISIETITSFSFLNFFPWFILFVWRQSLSV